MLQDLGWKDLEHALLVNSLGNMVELVNGEMVERDDHDDTDADASALESHENLGKSVSVTMYLVGILVALSVLLLMEVSWGAYRARYHVTWSAHSSSTSNPVWDSDLRKSQSLSIPK
jgi:cytochrome c-type biogenesis protein CcmH/NrfG